MIPTNEFATLHYSTPSDQAALLALIKEQTEEVGEEETLETAADDLAGLLPGIGRKAKRPAGDDGPKRSKAASTKGNSSLFKAWKKGRAQF